MKKNLLRFKIAFKKENSIFFHFVMDITFISSNEAKKKWIFHLWLCHSVMKYAFFPSLDEINVIMDSFQKSKYPLCIVFVEV